MYACVYSFIVNWLVSDCIFYLILLLSILAVVNLNDGNEPNGRMDSARWDVLNLSDGRKTKL